MRKGTAPAFELPPTADHRRPPTAAPRRREEQFYAVDDVLGRDASSVFPTEARGAALGSDAIKALLGGDRKFISETEVRARSPPLHPPAPAPRLPSVAAPSARRGVLA